MPGVRILGQQGSGNTSNAKQVAAANGEYQLSQGDGVVFAEDGAKITLPPDPYIGQSVTISVPDDVGAVTVFGGENPLIGGPTAVLALTSTSFIFTPKKKWIVKSGTGSNLFATYFDHLTEGVSIVASVEYTDLLTIVIPVKQGNKLLIFSSISFAHLDPEPETASTNFELTVNDGVTTTVLEEASQTSVGTMYKEIGALNGCHTPLVPGTTYTVKLRWRTDLGNAVIDPFSPEPNPSSNCSLTVLVTG